MYKSRKDPLINLFDIAIVISLGIITHHFSTARNILFIYLLHCSGLHKAIFIQVCNLLYINFLRFILTYVCMSLCVYAHMCANREIQDRCWTWWHHRRLVDARPGCGKLNSKPLQEQQACWVIAPPLYTTLQRPFEKQPNQGLIAARDRKYSSIATPSPLWLPPSYLPAKKNQTIYFLELGPVVGVKISRKV